VPVPRTLTILLLVGVVALVFFGMWRAWRARIRRTETFSPPVSTADIGTVVSTGDALYVATTVAGHPLDRLALSGLAYRAKATITATKNGVEIAPRGEHPVFMSAASISSIRAATWTVDRVVERDGLVAIAWKHGSTTVDTYLRIVDAAFRTRLTEAVRSLPHSVHPPLTPSTK
jgi:hypothetical protein